jgi:hypothetical protein
VSSSFGFPKRKEILVNKLAAVPVLLIAAWLAPLSAQNRTATFEPKYLTLNQYFEQVRMLITHTCCPQVFMTTLPELKLITIQGPADQITMAQELLRQYDVPRVTPARKPAEFTVYLVRASAKAADQKQPPAASRPIPAELDSVIAEMKRSFTYDSYSLLDALVVPVRGDTTIDSVLPDLRCMGQWPYFYTLALQNAVVADDGKSVWVSPLKFTIKIPLPGPTADGGSSGITTSVRLEEGQKEVLGKVRLDIPDTDIFLVVTVKLR